MPSNESDSIPIVETYRGIGIEDHQPSERIERIVRPAIDRIHATAGVHELFDYASDSGNPPEARLFAAAKIEATFAVAAEDRRVRPDVDLELVRAVVAGLNSECWRSRTHHASLLCNSGHAVEREEPLPDRDHRRRGPNFRQPEPCGNFPQGLDARGPDDCGKSEIGFSKNPISDRNVERSAERGAGLRGEVLNRGNH
jgi:hypothetical protein